MTIFSKHNQLIFSALASLFVLSSLPSCQREPSPVDENLYLTDELIRVEAQGSDMQTRGLLNSADLKKAGTTVKVYDYLTGFTGKMTVGQTTYDGTTTPVNVMYINDSVEYQDGDWNFSQYPWRWTRTGTHHFYGWLTKDKDGLTPASLVSEWTPAIDSNKLTVPAITFTKDSKQFDFSYSGIVTVEGIPSTRTVEIPLKHLFTALAVTVQNGASKALTVNSVTINGIKNGHTASVNYNLGAEKAGEAVLADGDSGTFSVWSGTTHISIDANETSKVNAYTGTAFPADGDFRLLWPQDDMRSASITVEYSIAGGTALSKKIFLAGIFKDGETVTNKMLAGTKYHLNLSISPKGLYVNVTVLPWTVASKYEYEYNLSTGLSAFESYWRYDLDEDYDTWAESYMAVSTGYMKDVEEGREDLPTGQEPTSEYYPKRSTRIYLKTTVSGIDDGLVLRLDNPKFKFVTYTPPVSETNTATGETTVVTPASYDHSFDGKIDIPVGSNELYFYVVPKERFSTSASDAEKICKVFLTTASTSVASIKIPFNSESLPGNSELSDEIWFYYLDDGVYGKENDGGHQITVQ